MNTLKNTLNTCIIILLIICTGISQSPTTVQIRTLNEYSKKFDLVKDDFFPDNDHYTHKDMSINFFGNTISYNKGIFPLLYKSDNFVMISVYHGSDWIFHNKIALKLNDEVIFVEAVKECTHEVIGSNIMEVCYYDLDFDLVKRLAETPDIKLRYYGKDGYRDMDFNAQIWKDTYTYYKLLDVCGKL